MNKRFEQHKVGQQRVAELERDKVILNNELDKAKRTRQIDFKEKQLSLFYWPIYFRFAKDSALWKIVPQLSDDPATLPDRVGREIELTQLIKNHEEIVSIVEANIHLAQADKVLLDLLAAYIKHVAVYKSLRATGTYDINPIDVGQPMPENLIAAIETRLQQLQSEYDALVRPR